MTNAADLRLAAQMGAKAYKQLHDRLTSREKLDALREERGLRAQEAADLRDSRRREVIGGGLVDESVQQRCAQLERDLEDYDAAIAEVAQKVAEEEAAAKLAAEQAAAAADEQRQAVRKQERAKAAAALDDAIARVEEATKTWIAEQRDLPLTLQNRRPFYLLAAMYKLAPETARLLEVKHMPHNHRRSLSEVTA